MLGKTCRKALSLTGAALSCESRPLPSMISQTEGAHRPLGPFAGSPPDGALVVQPRIQAGSSGFWTCCFLTQPQLAQGRVVGSGQDGGGTAKGKDEPGGNCPSVPKSERG